MGYFFKVATILLDWCCRIAWTLISGFLTSRFFSSCHNLPVKLSISFSLVSLAGSSEHFAMVSSSVTHKYFSFNIKVSSMLVPSTHRDSFAYLLFLFCPDYQPGCERYASFPHWWAAGRRRCRPEGLDSWTRSSRFVATHLLNYHEILSDDYLLVLLQAGTEPVPFLTVLTCYTRLSIASRPMLLPMYLWGIYMMRFGISTTRA